MAAPYSGEEYLAHCYEKSKLELLSDEDFVALWENAPESGQPLIDFLGGTLHLPTEKFNFADKNNLRLTLIETLGGRLPLFNTEVHADFCAMSSLIYGKDEPQNFPATVNAVTLNSRRESIYKHRVIILNNAPYSNIDAARVGLGTEEWLEKSFLIRRRHECAHYETLRLFGMMRNHALDEIIADSFGLRAAFGEADPDLLRLFFGLDKNKPGCTGRLSFYTRQVVEADRELIYQTVNNSLDNMLARFNEMTRQKEDDITIFNELLTRPIKYWSAP